MNNVSQKRLKIISFIIIIPVLFGIVKIFNIQIISNSRYNQPATAQKVTSVELQKTRGDFVDRSGILLTNRKERLAVVIKPDILLSESEAQKLRSIGNLLKLNGSSIESRLKNSTLPLVINIDESKARLITGIKSNNITFLYYPQRYEKKGLASHITGYISGQDGTGVEGLEKKYDTLLSDGNSIAIGALSDAVQKPLAGSGYRLIKETDTNGQSFSIKLTIDWHIQNIVEKVIDNPKFNFDKGAVVIIENSTGDVAAMASRPDYDRNSVSSYLGSKNGELFNRAVAAYSPGSVFKIITAACILEENEKSEVPILKIDDNIFCKGYIKIGDKIFKCSSYKNGGHGMVNLESAFISSCNTYFIKAAIMLGMDKISEMAQRLGLGSKTNLSQQGIYDFSGFIPPVIQNTPHANYSDGDMANIAIGQGSVSTTPLQLARLVSAISSGGILREVNITDSVINEKGNKIRNLRSDSSREIISDFVAKTLTNMMIKTVKEGTGKNAGENVKGGAGGKTGTAQTGGTKNSHAWFAGFFPAESPLYSVCVFSENGGAGGEVAAPIFAEIAAEIEKLLPD